jgi:hypothetical protein
LGGVPGFSTQKTNFIQNTLTTITNTLSADGLETLALFVQQEKRHMKVVQ